VYIVGRGHKKANSYTLEISRTSKAGIWPERGQNHHDGMSTAKAIDGDGKDAENGKCCRYELCNYSAT
jgi:hypothetical protein